MNDLASRIEQAEEADRDLDCEIALAIDGGEIIWLMANGTMEQYPARKYESSMHVGGFGKAPVPLYTSSMDAAISLVPEGRMWRCDFLPARHANKQVGSAFVAIDGDTYHGDARTYALALCAAALRARAAADNPALTPKSA